MEAEDDDILSRVPSDLMLNERAVVRSTGRMAIREVGVKVGVVGVYSHELVFGKRGFVRVGVCVDEA